MPTTRQARHGPALLSVIASVAISTATAAPPAHTDQTVMTGEGDDDRGLGRTRPLRRIEGASPDPPPKAANARLRDSAEKLGRITPNRPSTAATPADSADRQSYNEYLVRDRSIAICLTKARRAIAENRSADAVSNLQSLLDASSDVFLWQEGHIAPVSARACAAEMFRELSPATLAEYERQYGGDAQRLLEEFRGDATTAACRELLRRFEFTAAGAEALRLAADNAFDRGRFAEAARLYQRRQAHPLTAASSDSAERLRAVAAAELAAGEGHDAVSPPNDEHDKQRWSVAFGSPQAHRQSRGTMPTVDPLWSAAHSADPLDDGVRTVAYESDESGSEFLAHWMESRIERRLPCAGATFAIADKQRLIVRDYQGISTRDIRTGDLEWSFACESGLIHRAEQMRRASNSATPEPPLAASLLFNELVAQNSVLGMLSSNGRYVFCVDLRPPPDADAAASEDGESNRILALVLDAESGEPGSLAWQTADEGWYFLGVPQPTEAGLFAVAERDSLVCVLSLNPDTGELLWEQPISMVDAAIADDPQRARQACTPTISGGILICPTQLGSIVAVNAESGELEWVYRYEESRGPSQPWRKTRAFDREYGSPEFPNLPVVVGGTVIVLAPQSKDVHAIDLHAGTFRWKQDREQAQYAATAGNDLVLLVGVRQCQARRIADGTEVWSQAIKTPAGRGLAVGDAYLLPTQDGRIMAIDISTGQIAPDLLPRSSRRQGIALRPSDAGPLAIDLPTMDPRGCAGNLLCSGDFIVSCSPCGVAVYPQAGVVLDAMVRESRDSALTSAGWLERGELELRLGKVIDAEESLWNVLSRDSDLRTRRVAESRLRELMYTQLAVGDDPHRRLACLAKLSVDPADRARFLAHRLDHELQTEHAAAAIRTLGDIRELGISQPIAMDAFEEYCVVPTRYATAAIGRYLQRAAPQGRGALLRTVASKASGAQPDHTELDGLTFATPDLQSSEASRLAAAGDFQAAELRLIAASRLHAVVNGGQMQERLAALWRECGLHRGADHLLAETKSPSEGLRRTRLARVEIEQHIDPDDETVPVATVVQKPLEELLERQREYAPHAQSTRVLLDRGPSGGPDRTSALSVIDLAEPSLVADLAPLPARIWKTGNGGPCDAGHFIPIAGQDDIHGISLLEGRILWSASDASHGTGKKPQLGPYAPDYCIVQSHETVTALHPLDGRVLWRRTDLPYDAGLVRDQATGMLADDVALVIFDSDLTTYRLLDPSSGEQLKAGVLEPSSEPRRRGWPFGRRLLYLTRTPEPRLRMWDPLCSEPVLDEPCGRRCLIDSGLGHGLAVILNGRRLSVLDTRSGERVWETELTEETASATRQLRSFCESGRLCIHLEQDVPDSPTGQATHDIKYVPNVPLSGPLFVIDRHSGGHWSRRLPRCNLLLFPCERLPALITVGRTREGRSRTDVGLVVEVIDIATGRTLASRDDLARKTMMFLHASFDPEQQSVELRGRDTHLSVRLESE